MPIRLSALDVSEGGCKTGYKAGGRDQSLVALPVFHNGGTLKRR